MMTVSGLSPDNMPSLDDATRALVRAAAIVSAGNDDAVRQSMLASAGVVPDLWMEELLLQTYLFAGFPRALNAMREWRRLRPVVPSTDHDREPDEYREDGERTCAAVYGSMYERLRENIRALHPRLDDWMISEGYGKVLSRPGLDLQRRELCIVAACAASNQDRQLHSHLHGALNVGVSPNVLTAALHAIADLLGDPRAENVRRLWSRVRGT
jgi:4-carboxymuconolactone decarboxylase